MVGLDIINCDAITMRGSNHVVLKKDIIIHMTWGTSIHIPIEYVADFTNIPLEHHSIALQSFIASSGGLSENKSNQLCTKNNKENKWHNFITKIWK